MAIEKRDAVALLTADHREVETLFSEYEREMGNVGARRAISAQVCAALTVHAMIEEEIFYPAVRAGLPDKEEQVDEALIEHFLIKTLIGRFERMTVDEAGFDAAFHVLSQNVRQHVREEEEEMFPAVEESSLDLAALGLALDGRKRELMRQIAPTAV